MATAQNGWPVVEADQMDKGPIFGNVSAPNGVLKGDVAVVFRWLAGQYNKRVEPLVAGTCWGYDKRKIEGSDQWSTHAAGCGLDLNADQHNMGDTPSHSFSQAQIDTCHTLESESAGTLRWGGDFSRPDGMHWEIIGTPAQAASFAAKIEGKASGMFLPVKGDEGPEVEFWQYELADAGCDPGAKDGIYGPKMEAAVNKHRAKYGEGPYARITGWHGRTLLRDAIKASAT
jgi:hypothetical protein